MIVTTGNFWEKLTAAYSTNKPLVSALWKEIEVAYSSPDRYYHNLGHIHFMLKLAEQYRAELQQPDEIYFSVFYHDFIYEASSSDNEARSAAVAIDRLRQLKPALRFYFIR